MMQNVKPVIVAIYDVLNASQIQCVNLMNFATLRMSHFLLKHVNESNLEGYTVQGTLNASLAFVLICFALIAIEIQTAKKMNFVQM